MTTPVHDIGDMRRCSALFKNIGGDDADPVSVTASVREPDGTNNVFVYGVDAELVRDATGKYHLDWTIAMAGRHSITWTTTGVPQLSESTEFHAKRKTI